MLLCDITPCDYAAVYLPHSSLMDIRGISSVRDYEEPAKIALSAPLVTLPGHMHRNLYKAVVVKCFSLGISKSFCFCIFYLQIFTLLAFEAEENMNVFT